MSELLPCPFCGGTAEVVSDSAGGDFSPDFFYPQCRTCGHEWPSSFDTPAEAIAAWNRRPQPVSVGSVEELRGIFNAEFNKLREENTSIYLGTLKRTYSLEDFVNVGWKAVHAHVSALIQSSVPIDAIKAILESHGPGTITPDWAYESLCDWLNQKEAQS